MNATIIAREDLSASDADLDIIYYELNSTVQVSIFLWGEKKKKSEREVFVFNSDEPQLWG